MRKFPIASTLIVDIAALPPTAGGQMFAPGVDSPTAYSCRKLVSAILFGVHQLQDDFGRCDVDSGDLFEWDLTAGYALYMSSGSAIPRVDRESILRRVYQSGQGGQGETYYSFVDGKQLLPAFFLRILVDCKNARDTVIDRP